MLNNSTILVTGGAGFIGSNIVKELLETGNTVNVLDNFATGKRENLLPYRNHPKFKLFEGDLRSFHIVRDAVKGCEFVMHQGALPSVPRSIADPITTNDVNILGTLNVLEAAKEFKVRRVVFASSSSVYGNNPELPKHEEMPVMPLSPYAITKYAGERYCQIFYNLYGLETVALRYFNVFGPNQDPTSQYSAVIPKFIKAIINNESPTIYGDGMQSRDFTFVANNVMANILACISPNAPGEAINIACGERFTLIDLVNEINRILGRSIEPKFELDRAGDVKHSLASIDKAMEIVDFMPQVSFKVGLERTVEFFRK